MYPGANIGSNYELVRNLKLKVKRLSNTREIRFDLEKLQDTNVAEVFMATVGGKFAALNLVDCHVETVTRNIKEVLLSTAQKVLGQQRNRTQH